MKNWVVNNFWIKIVSLILAIITWFYVNGELSKEGRISRDYYKRPLLDYTQKRSSVENTKMNRGYVVENR